MPSIQASSYSPTIKKRALRCKLVDLREQCGMTTSEVCKRLHWSPSKLTREAHQHGWWRKYNDVFTNEFPGFKAGASEIWTYQTMFSPGLLQIAEYIKLVRPSIGIGDDAEIQRHVDARLERQRILAQNFKPCRFHALVDESAVFRISDDAVRAAQISHVLAMTERENVRT